MFDLGLSALTYSKLGSFPKGACSLSEVESAHLTSKNFCLCLCTRDFDLLCDISVLG